MTPEDCNRLVNTARAVFPASFVNTDSATVVPAWYAAVRDLDYADCSAQLNFLIQTGHGPYVTPQVDIRLPLLRRLGVLAPTPLEAWEAVSRYVNAGWRAQLMVTDLDPIIREAFETSTFQAEVSANADGLRFRDATWSRKLFVEDVYPHVARRHDVGVLAGGNTAAAVEAAKAAGPRVLLATDWKDRQDAEDALTAAATGIAIEAPAPDEVELAVLAAEERAAETGLAQDIGRARAMRRAFDAG